jgi:hypothetical protein
MINLERSCTISITFKNGYTEPSHQEIRIMLNVTLVIVLLHNFSSNNNCHVSFSLPLMGEGKDTQKEGDGSK